MKEFILWSVLFVFALFLLHFSPFSLWDSLPIFVFLLGLVFYFRQTIKAFSGKLISKKEVVLGLPVHQAIAINVEKIRDINLVLHLKNISFLFLNGNIQVKNSSGELLGKIDLPEAKGFPNKAIFGQDQILGPPGKTQPRVRTKQLFIKDNEQSQLLLELNLAWNFEGWNTHWERSLPSDRKLHLEYLVKAI